MPKMSFMNGFIANPTYDPDYLNAGVAQLSPQGDYWFSQAVGDLDTTGWWPAAVDILGETAVATDAVPAGLSWIIQQVKDGVRVGTGAVIPAGGRTAAMVETFSYPQVSNANVLGAARHKMYLTKSATEGDPLTVADHAVRTGIQYQFTDTENANSSVFIVPQLANGGFNTVGGSYSRVWTLGGGSGCGYNVADYPYAQCPWIAGTFKNLTVVALTTSESSPVYNGAPNGHRSYRFQVRANNTSILEVVTALTTDRVFSTAGPSTAIADGDLIHVYVELAAQSGTFGNAADLFYLTVMFDPI